VRILGISGSLRRGSHNRRLLRAAGALLPPGVELVEWDGLAGLPAYDEDLEDAPPEAVREFLACVEDADALLIATPEYNYSFPGVLKNAIDWASRPPDQPLNGKPAALMGATPGLGATIRAQHHLRQVLVFVNVLPLNQPQVLIAEAAKKFDPAGRLTDETTRGFLRQLLEALGAWTRRLGRR